MTGVRKGAHLSTCGLYRYQLSRLWGLEHALPFVMLNPSTADADIDDPTIRRCVGFARREGAGGIIVSNVYAFRATSPADMKAAVDPFGPDNDLWLNTLADWAARANRSIVCAWGTNADENAVKRTMRSLRTFGATTVCLGKTAGGHPRHPLYVKADQPLVPFE